MGGGSYDPEFIAFHGMERARGLKTQAMNRATYFADEMTKGRPALPHIVSEVDRHRILSAREDVAKYYRKDKKPMRVTRALGLSASIFGILGRV